MELSLGKTSSGVEIYNIADIDSPTFADIRRKAGRKTSFNIPVVFDFLKGIRISRSPARRYPLSLFRLDNTKLIATGFVINDK